MGYQRPPPALGVRKKCRRADERNPNFFLMENCEINQGFRKAFSSSYTVHSNKFKRKAEEKNMVIKIVSYQSGSPIFCLKKNYRFSRSKSFLTLTLLYNQLMVFGLHTPQLWEKKKSAKCTSNCVAGFGTFCYYFWELYIVH